MSKTEDPQLDVELLAEPYRIKMVEPIRLLSRAEREQRLKEAFYSPVFLSSEDVFIDLVTDSGTGAMSDEQWAEMMRGDESYIQSPSFSRLDAAVQALFEDPQKKQDRKAPVHVLPTHQGRAAEHILMSALVKRGDIVLSNTHFDTTRAHVENREAQAVELVGDDLWNFDEEKPFKGNFDLDRLQAVLRRYGEGKEKRVSLIVITVLNNLACSSPVSMENIREVKRLADRWGIPVYFDACRIAENAHFIKTREAGYRDKSIPEIVREMLSYGEGCWMSAKKDALVNIGGFLAVKDQKLARLCQEKLVLYEGFVTYGGLAGRDMEAIAVGLREGLDETYLAHRIGQVAYLAERFEEVGVQVSKPAGGSGVFVNVESLYKHLPAEKRPGMTMVCSLYLEGGVRAGAIPFHLNRADPRTGEIVTKDFQFARFAIPRRVYTKGHLDYVAKVMGRVKEKAPQSKGYRLIEEPEGVLGHFFAKYEPR